VAGERWNLNRILRLLAATEVVASIAIACLGLAMIRPWSPDTPLGNDFISFWMAGALIREGKGSDLYDMEVQRAFQARLRLEEAQSPEIREKAAFLIPFHNPPAMAIVMAPFSLLPIPLAWALWSILSLLALVAAVALPLRGHRYAVPMAIALMSFGPVFSALRWGQMVGFLLLSLSLGLFLFRSGRPFLGGVALGMLLLKPQYAAVMVVVLMAKARWRELSGMAAAAAVLALLSLWAAGGDGLLSYLYLLNRIGGVDPPAESLVKPDVMVNWRNLLWHAWPTRSTGALQILLLMLEGATVLLALLAWRGEWDPESGRFADQVLAAVLATLVAVPHSHIHGAVLLLAPVAAGMGSVEGRGGQDTPRLIMLMVGYLVGLVVGWIDGLSWAMAVYFLAALAMLTLSPGLVHERAADLRAMARLEVLFAGARRRTH